MPPYHWDNTIVHPGEKRRPCLSCSIHIDLEVILNRCRASLARAGIEVGRIHDLIQRKRIFEYLGIGIIPVYLKTNPEDDVPVSKFILQVKCPIDRLIGSYQKLASAIRIHTGEEIIESDIIPDLIAQIIVSKIVNHALIRQLLYREHIQTQIVRIEGIDIHVIVNGLPGQVTDFL